MRRKDCAIHSQASHCPFPVSKFPIVYIHMTVTVERGLNHWYSLSICQHMKLKGKCPGMKHAHYVFKIPIALITAYPGSIKAGHSTHPSQLKLSHKDWLTVVIS